MTGLGFFVVTTIRPHLFADRHHPHLALRHLLEPPLRVVVLAAEAPGVPPGEEAAGHPGGGGGAAEGGRGQAGAKGGQLLDVTDVVRVLVS